jgi:hypothetical protein
MVEMKPETAIAVNANPARIVIAEGKVRIYDMSDQSLPAMAGGDTDSPHRGGQAVARAAKIPHSTWPKRSQATRPRDVRLNPAGSLPTRRLPLVAGSGQEM